MLFINSLPAGHGDCIWIEFGNKNQIKRILIDGGTGEGAAYKILDKKIRSIKESKVFELLIVTHIDADHIGGVLQLLKNYHTLGITFKDIWFNGYCHLEPGCSDLLGPLQGEALTEILVKQQLPWNKAFDGNAVVIPKEGALPSVLIGEMKLTLLSPAVDALQKLKPKWEKIIKEAGLLPGVKTVREKTESDDDLLGDVPIDVKKLALTPFRSDKSLSNSSSIAVLAEYDGKSCLFAGDAHGRTISDSIKRLIGKGKKLKVDVFKLPHHSSKNNVSQTLLKNIDCKNYIVSTNGDYFRHPDREAIARVIVYSGNNARLLFNYRSACNEIWDNTILKNDPDHPYQTSYALSDNDGISIKLSTQDTGGNTRRG